MSASRECSGVGADLGGTREQVLSRGDAPTPQRCDVSVVVPTFRGADSLPQLCRRIARSLDRAGLGWQIILVDDASPDGTPLVAQSMSAADPRILYVRLPRNGGQHRATVTGLALAAGDVVVTMDDDLQHLPESIPALLDGLGAGREVAIARFTASAHPWWRRAASVALRRAMRRRAGLGELEISSFKAFRSAAARRLVAGVPAEGPFYLAAALLRTTPRSAIVNVDVPHRPRVHGRSGYGPAALLRLAWLALGRGHRSP